MSEPIVNEAAHQAWMKLWNERYRFTWRRRYEGDSKFFPAPRGDAVILSLQKSVDDHFALGPVLPVGADGIRP